MQVERGQVDLIRQLAAVQHLWVKENRKTVRWLSSNLVMVHIPEILQPQARRWISWCKSFYQFFQTSYTSKKPLNWRKSSTCNYIDIDKPLFDDRTTTAGLHEVFKLQSWLTKERVSALMLSIKRWRRLAWREAFATLKPWSRSLRWVCRCPLLRFPVSFRMRLQLFKIRISGRKFAVLVLE